MPEGMDAAGEAVGATTPWLSPWDAVGRWDVQPSLVTTMPRPPLPSSVLSLRGFSPPNPASAFAGSHSPPCQLFNLSLQLMNQTQRLQTRHFNEVQVQSQGD